MNSSEVSISRRDGRTSIDYAGANFVGDLGIGLPINKNWWWTFDRTMKLVEERDGSGRDNLGEHSYTALDYTIPGLLKGDPAIIQQQLKIYHSAHGPGRVMIQTRVLEDIRGTDLEDSFFNTTFNSPVLLFQKGLNFLGYTWGLIGVESSRDGGHFPEAITGKDVANIPSKLRSAGYSPKEDLSTTSEKPFAPLVLYDDEGRTLVISPFNHPLISPLRVIQTPAGMGVARGLHGSVSLLPQGTTTQTALVFGEGVVETLVRWGDWLLEAGGKGREVPEDNPLLGSIGFWNCFGGYYTELFRQADEKTLEELARYFRDERIPLGYFGLDLWYNYTQVGFARNYAPDDKKYPRGLEPIHEETGLPYLLHMSAFESPNDYVGRYEFAMDRRSSYPVQRELYDGLARDFKKSGAFGIWPDFLRTQLQNCRSLRDRIGSADQWFDGLAGAFADQDMVMMMCMPTIGHYLASTRYRNIIAVRTHTDYLNHQKNQVETLRVTGQVRNSLPLQQSIRHNVLLSLLAHSLGLCPSFDVFLTNRAHPEGFGEPNAETEALIRAMSAGVVGVGDKAGFIDKQIIKKLCFPDGRTSRPDHPPFPVVSTLQSDVLAFYTTTTLGQMRWVYLAVFNVGQAGAHYRLDMQEVAGEHELAAWDYFRRKVVHATALEGDLEPAQGHYYVLMPEVGGACFLGFPDKYITVSSRQVSSIEEADRGFTVNLRLPRRSPDISPGIRRDLPLGSTGGTPSDRTPLDESRYTVAAYTHSTLEVRATGAEILSIWPDGDLLHVEFAPASDKPSLNFRRADNSC